MTPEQRLDRLETVVESIKSEIKFSTYVCITIAILASFGIIVLIALGIVYIIS